RAHLRIVNLNILKLRRFASPAKATVRTRIASAWFHASRLAAREQKNDQVVIIVELSTQAMPAAENTLRVSASEPLRSMARQASSITSGAKPSRLASSAENRTQKSKASPARKTRVIARSRR